MQHFFLPNTANSDKLNDMNKELPKAYNPKEYEDRIYKKWGKSGYFSPDKCVKDGIAKKNAKSFTIALPPPNRTGTLHIGHALMLVVQDILIRYHRMKGYKTLWIPGTDHAAIATQSVVEKKLYAEEKKTRHDLGREKFLKQVYEFADKSHKRITEQVKKMGSSLDWSREAYTLDEARTRTVQTVFKMMYDDGLIYRGDRVVNWCPRCHSTLADDEVEYKTQKAKLYTFKYSKNFPFAIATTRPETKLGDTAVAVNPKDERYKKYIGKIYEIDFVGVALKLKIIADRAVDAEFGTGAVGVTPAHSMADWQMAQEHKLNVVKVINEDGKICEDLSDYSAKTVEQAREMIVKKLKEQELFEKEEEMENNLSLCYRCHTPIEPLPSLQWFINVNKPLRGRKQKTKNRKQGLDIEGKTLKEIALGVVKSGKIKIIPERFEKNYFHWMENLRDWCISRQIWFGHRVPVWYKEKLEVRSKKLEVNKDNNNEIYVGVEPPKGEGWQQDEDTLDTWFSSGLWTFSTLANNPDQIKIKDGKLIIDSDDFKNFHPTTVMETGYDILFFWVARMIIMTTYAVGDIPFRDVYLHGLVRDERGRKMSKSLGNAIDPLDVCAKYGTDAVRLSLIIGTTPGNDLNLSEEKIAGYRNFANKLWNIARYILQTTENSKQPACADRKTANSKATEWLASHSVADKWILGEMQKLIKQVSEDLDNYRFSQAGEKLRDFTWNDFADWYIEVSKFEKNSEKDKILMIVLQDLLKLWHPFMPFVTEVIWSEMGEQRFLMVEKWPESPHLIPQPPLLIRRGGGERSETGVRFDDFEPIKNIIIAIRSARSQYRIKPSQKIKAIIYAGENKELIESQAELIKKLRTGIDELEIKKSGGKIKDAIYLTVNNVEIYLEIFGFDFKAEAKRLGKEIKGQEARINILEKKLSNKQFVKKAPTRIVDQEKEKLGLWQEELEKIKEQLNHLK